MGAADFDAFYRDNASFYGDRPALSLIYYLDKYNVQGGGLGLDLGCGQGRNALFLAERGFSMCGMDQSAEAIATLGERADKLHLDVCGRVADLGNSAQVDIKPRTYRIIVAYTLLDHLDPTAGECLAEAMMEGLVPGGFLFVSVFLRDDPGCCGRGGRASETAAYIRHYYQPGELRRQFGALEPLAYQEEYALDLSHGWAHHHSMARLFARKPTH
ncbi:class I SAM-dependent methyltransferase [Chromobacterium paludis]|uniref:Methyltransferase domain-containing protein n=1 Tax=Chromobacterium paludis TaxID=2605945 RepID=A0A5C1DHV0_9NEIS|nr:methyltransferase domain-containing protein [Chromobacterium paludis]QEL56153.1 methyltransferase domain-containing protein [Chromobacterium paludis]